MKKNADNISDYGQLRKAALALLEKETIQETDYTREQLNNLIQEFRIYKIELELQNEELQNTQEQLGKTLNKYSALFNAAPLAIILIDEDSNIVEANYTSAVLFGVEWNQLINTKLNQWIDREWQDEFHFRILSIFHEVPSIKTEMGFRKNTGEPVLGWVVGRKVEVPHERPVMQLIINDITEQKQHETRLKLLSQQLGERIKELKCRSLISGLMEKEEMNLDELFTRSIRIIADAMLYPELALVGISFNGKEHGNSARKMQWSYLAEFVTAKGTKGYIRAGYPENPSIYKENPMLPEEIELLIQLALKFKLYLNRKETELELSGKTEELDRYFKETLDLLCIANTEGYFLRLNPEWKNTLGYEENELLNTPFLELIHPDDVNATVQALTRLSDKQEVRNFENRYRCKDGSYKWIEWRSRPAGNLIYAAARDITARKQMEEALRQSEQKYRAITDNAADVIWLMDIETNKFTYVSPSVLQLRGYTPEEVMEQPVENALTPESAEMVNISMKNSFEKYYNEGILENSTISYVDQPCKDGSVVNTEVMTTFLLDDQGKIKEVLGISRNITEKLKTEKILKESEQRLRDLNATKDKFFSIIAHDLKNPFNSILGFGELLLSEYDYYSDEEKKTYISLINNISENTFILLQNLLEWARSQTGALEYKPVKTDLCTEINSVIQLLLPDAKKKDIVLFSGVLYNTPVFADRDMLSTILRNLVSNAIKFSANGSKVRILAETEGRFQKITVIDHGVGISEATIPKLFKIEEKVSTPGTQNEKGTGLGLLLCKEFVEKMEGKIWVESNPGQGSRFYFTIPTHQF